VSPDRIGELIARNRAWAARRTAEDPEIFARLARGQRPFCLWIGCSDSRVAPETIVDVGPGALFVHRNVANLVRPDDPNLLSVLEFGLGELGIEEVVVCGHEGCGGVARALEEPRGALVDDWLRPVRQLARSRADELGRDGVAGDRLSRLVALNVADQLHRLAGLPLVRRLRRSRPLRLHGLVFDIASGRLRRVATDP